MGEGVPCGPAPWHACDAAEVLGRLATDPAVGLDASEVVFATEALTAAELLACVGTAGVVFVAVELEKVVLVAWTRGPAVAHAEGAR